MHHSEDNFPPACLQWSAYLRHSGNHFIHIFIAYFYFRSDIIYVFARIDRILSICLYMFGYSSNECREFFHRTCTPQTRIYDWKIKDRRFKIVDLLFFRDVYRNNLACFRYRQRYNSAAHRFRFDGSIYLPCSEYKTETGTERAFVQIHQFSCFQYQDFPATSKRSIFSFHRKMFSPIAKGGMRMETSSVVNDREPPDSFTLNISP